MNKSELLRICDEYGLHPNKSLGQNFLIDDSVVQRIIDHIEPSVDDSVLEIGPGVGSVTKALLDTAGRVHAIEIDAGLSRYLSDAFSGDKKFSLTHGDFLKIEHDDAYTKVVSNLPYYCASEILFTVALKYSAERVFVMLQKEMAERIVSAPGSEQYGALTVTLGLYFRPKNLFGVGRFSFYPVPDVSSSFMLLERRGDLPFSGDMIELFHLIVKSAFWGRRKTLIRALSESPHISLSRDIIAEALDNCGISIKERGERLSLDEYIALTKALDKMD